MTAEQIETAAWLNRAYHNKHRIDALITQRTRLRELAERLAKCAQGSMSTGNTSAKNSTEDALERFIDIELELTKEIKELADSYLEINSAINCVIDPLLRTILKRRYLCFETMEQIAEAIHYSVRATKYKHKEALKKIAPFCIVLHSGMC